MIYKSTITAALLISAGTARKANSGRSYKLEVQGDYFGLLHVDRETYVIAWPGQIEIGFIKNITESLRSMIIDNPEFIFSFGNRATRKHTSSNEPTESLATVVVADQHVWETNEVTVSISQLDLKMQADVENHEVLFHNPSKIVYVRYDQRYAEEGSKEGGGYFSFSAENPDYTSDRSGELAIRQSRSQLKLVELLEWILERHEIVTYRVMDVPESARVLHKLITNRATPIPPSGGGLGWDKAKSTSAGRGARISSGGGHGRLQ